MTTRTLALVLSALSLATPVALASRVAQVLARHGAQHATPEGQFLPLASVGARVGDLVFVHVRGAWHVATVWAATSTTIRVVYGTPTSRAPYLTGGSRIADAYSLVADLPAEPEQAPALVAASGRPTVAPAPATDGGLFALDGDQGALF